MNKLFRQAVLLICFLCGTFFSFAQTLSGNERHKIAVFTPLYLDRVMDANGIPQFTGNNFPKESIPGLEFYHGVSMAIDSLNSLNIPLDIYIYDSKSSKETVEKQFDKAAKDGVELIIANSSLADLGKLAQLAATKKILLLNATVPNSANTVHNPYFVVLNPTLQTQVASIFDYLHKNYTNRPIQFISRNGNNEKYLKSIFQAFNKKNGSQALHINYLDVRDSLSSSQIQSTIQPGQNTLFVVGSLDLAFGDKILSQLSRLAKNNAEIVTVGMPTWDNLDLSNYKNIEVIYSTPFYNPKTDATSKMIIDYYGQKMFARPSDLVFRGFGLTYKFGRLVSEHMGTNFTDLLQNKNYKVFYDYDIQPVLDAGKEINYFENKKLYFVKYVNGAFSSVN